MCGNYILLLKAILSRKLVVPEMHDVMKKIEELSITAHDGQVRQNCRQVSPRTGKHQL